MDLKGIKIKIMSGEIKLKKLFLYAVIVLVIYFTADIIFKPYMIIDNYGIEKIFDKIHQSQNISPQRLYVNAWRTARNEYADKTMNNQDWNRWRYRYKGKIKTMDDANIAINTMLASLNDDYTRFLKSNLYSKEKSILDSKITGVGVTFDKADDGVTISKILKNSSAYFENLMPGDKIVSINGLDVNTMSPENLQSYMEPKKDEKITLAIKRGDNVVVKELVSDDIPIDTMGYRITKDNIGIITLANIMGENALDDFKSIIKKTNDTKGIILDLRNNYGGILANSVQMADMMFKNGHIVSIKSRDKIKYKLFADNISEFKEKPIVILVNYRTASAAEIFAGALKYNLNAVIIGENTYGKNSIQHIIPLANNTGMIITSEKYILPDGSDIQGKGITPDYKYPLLRRTKLKDELMEKAEEIINKSVKKN